MKKVLALVLCALTLLSCMTVVSFADETPARIDVTMGATMDGWKSENGAAIDAELGALAIKKSGTCYANGGWKGPTQSEGFKFDYRATIDPNNASSFDVSGMKYLVFDLYVSNAATIENVTFDIELGSNNAQNVTFETKTWLQWADKALVDGWNRIEVSFDKMNNRLKSKDKPFDSTGWDYLRILNRSEFDAGDELVIAIKNVGFSVVSEAAEAAKAAAQDIIDRYTALEAVTDVTADNYETVQAQLAAAREAFDAAEVGVQDAANEAVNIRSIEKTVLKAIKKYEDELNNPVDPDPVDPVDPVDPDPVVPDDPTGDPDPVDPVDPQDPADDDEGGLSPVVIVVIAVAAVAVVAVVVIVLIKKKK